MVENELCDESGDFFFDVGFMDLSYVFAGH